MVLLHCSIETAQSSASSVNLPALLATIFAGIVSTSAIIFNFQLSKRSLNEKREEEKRAFMKSQLNEFYGPMIQLREKSNIIYKKFRGNFIEKNPEFSTLTWLLKGHQFEGNEEVLLQQIISIGGLCESLIHEKAGFITNPKLRDELIPRASTHFLLIRLAYEGDLKGQEELYKDMTFPKELDQALRTEKERIEAELSQSLKKP